MVQNANRQPQHIIVPTLPSMLATPTPTNAPTVTPSPVETTVAESPDGIYSLIMKKQPATNQTTYTFYTSTAQTTTPVEIYTATVDPSSSFSLPFNAWAPDDKTVFIKEMTASTTNYLVIPQTGTVTTNPTNIQSLFAQRYPTYSIENVTGWAANNLLVVNTKTPGGNMESFWFDTTTQGFIPLAHRFF